MVSFRPDPSGNGVESARILTKRSFTHYQSSFVILEGRQLRSQRLTHSPIKNDNNRHTSDRIFFVSKFSFNTLLSSTNRRYNHTAIYKKGLIFLQLDLTSLQDYRVDQG